MWRCFIFPFWLGDFLHTMVIGYQSSTYSSVPVLIWHSLGTLQLKVVLAFRDLKHCNCFHMRTCADGSSD